MRVEVLHLDQGMLLALRRVRFAGPLDNLAGFRIEDGYQFGVRTCAGAGASALMIASYPFLLVSISVQVDAERQELGAPSSGLQDFPAHHRIHSRFRMGDQLV